MPSLSVAVVAVAAVMRLGVLAAVAAAELTSRAFPSQLRPALRCRLQLVRRERAAQSVQQVRPARRPRLREAFMLARQVSPATTALLER